MLRKSLALLSLTMLVPLAAAADGLIAKFDGGIGVHPVSNVTGTANADGSFPNVTRNIVRGVNPAGQIWVIERLQAAVSDSGRIRVDGKGLVLAGGNNIGRATGQMVFATLICEAAAPFTEHNTNTSGVPLDANGDFRIDDALLPAAFECASPVLLIRSAAGGAWFAAGILKQ
jgi:hypothetical protein